MILVRVSPNHVGFHCPGCDDYHQIDTDLWQWDGNMDAPTISPSLLVTYQVTNHPERSTQCHSFITAGRIQFLGDCTHALAGQTVDLPEWKGFAQ